MTHGIIYILEIYQTNKQTNKQLELNIVKFNHINNKMSRFTIDVDKEYINISGWYNIVTGKRRHLSEYDNDKGFLQGQFRHLWYCKVNLNLYTGLSDSQQCSFKPLSE